MYNCTLTGNSATNGGGAYQGTLRNCIVYFNTAPGGTNSNYSGGAMNFCCAAPLPQGTGNTNADPELASAFRISPYSPCRGAGNRPFSSGLDIDGEDWANPPSMGCDEYRAGSLSGPLSASILANYLYVTPGFPVQLTGLIAGRASDSLWNFDDGTLLLNEPYASHEWYFPGDYTVMLTAYNEQNPLGVSAAPLTIHVVPDVIHYVSQTSVNPAPPYTSWSTAATNIQDALDAIYTAPGAVVLVSNGVYATGGRAVSGAMTNRVVVNKPVALVSVNGPQFTTIAGWQVPRSVFGDGAVRCVYLTNGAFLAGFTLTGGATRGSGDARADQSGGGVWCQSASAVVSNCVLIGNAATNQGGGSYQGTLLNCILTGNWAAQRGGGAYSNNLVNCAIIGNSATNGGGTYSGTLSNCTLTGNSAVNGGGMYLGSLRNCIAYYNTASSGKNYSGGTFNYCCTTPLPNGTGNTNADPQLASAWHLSAGSPCRGAGDAAYSSGADIDGEPWANPPSIGCDEYWTSSATGALSVSISAPLTNVVVGVPLTFTAQTVGRTLASQWDFGDGTVLSNEAYASHAWAALGDYTVVLTAYNEDHPAGINATVEIHVVPQVVHYVSQSSANPVSPYASWSTAATNIQDAIDAVYTSPQALVLVSNGVYASGGRVAASPTLTNRIVVSKPMTVMSANGPLFTSIRGYQMVPGPTNGSSSVRCAYLTNGAVLSGFTLTNGATLGTGYVGDVGGGAVACESGAIVTNCVLAGNAAGSFGGAAFAANDITLNDCTLSNNRAPTGGAVHRGTLNRCTLTGNRADYGGAVCASVLNDCLLLRNVARYDGGAAYARISADSVCVLSNCVVADNLAQNGGGAAGNSGGPPNSLNNCLLSNNVASASGGGAYYCILSGCTLISNTASLGGGGADHGTLSNCTLSGNSAYNGGGANWSTMADCTLMRNTATNSGGGACYGALSNCILGLNWAKSLGGGACYATLNSCRLIANRAVTNGGGACQGALSDCLLSGNTARVGGGAYFATLNRCELTGNSAGTDGGGTYQGTLNNCVFSGNTAPAGSGGAGYNGTFINCTLSGNSATQGGGVYSGTLNNCIVYYNTAPTSANYYMGSLYYCCTMPKPGGAPGNTTNAPLFVDVAGNNLRLQSNSPCINAGQNAYAPGLLDVEGNPRKVGGTVDMGAYECQAPELLSYFTWLQGYGLPTDTASLYGDSDGDSANNWQEWRCQTVPTNALSMLRMRTATPVGASMAVTWESAPGVIYFLERSTDLTASPPFSLLATNVTGQVDTTTYTDTNAMPGSPLFYRVGVGP